MFSVPSGLRSSAVRRSVIVALTGLPGKNFAPPEAKKIVPLKSTARPWPKLTLKFLTPMRRSSNSRMPPRPTVRVATSAFGSVGGGRVRVDGLAAVLQLAPRRARSRCRGRPGPGCRRCDGGGSSRSTPNFGNVIVALLQREDLLARRRLRVVRDVQARAGDRRRRRARSPRAGDAEAELAGQFDAHVAAQQAEGVDADVERAEHADQLDAHAAVLDCDGRAARCRRRRPASRARRRCRSSARACRR